jgi:serine/threonine-protein kinase
MQSTGKVINFNRVKRPETSAPKRKKPKILFVDDEERILNTMQALFRRQYDTTTTTDGYHALELLKQDHYHLLVSDQRMPIMPGVDLLREAKKVSPDTVRILLTGFSDLAAIIGSVNDGEVFRFLNKPWVTEEFVATVDEAVNIGLELEEAATEALLTPNQTLPAKEQSLDNHSTEDDLEAGESSEQALEPTSPFPKAADVYRENIVVLHGDEAMLTSIRSLLSGCQIFAANNQDEAIELMMEHEIGVIVSNVNDDHETALEFFSLLKREHPQVVAVLLANSGDSSTLIHLINNARVFRYMFKPIRERLMGRYLNSAIEQYQKFKVAPTLLKQQTVQDKKPAPKSKTAGIDTINGDNGKTIATASVENEPSIMGKMRKIRSFFSRLVSG